MKDGENVKLRAFRAAFPYTLPIFAGSKTQIVWDEALIPGKTYTGTAYYVSNQGDDGNDGLSPETAWSTLDRVNQASLEYGDAVFLERAASGGTPP